MKTLGPFETMLERRLTITQAAKALAKLGYEFLSAETYDLKNKTARYKVRFPDRSTHILTPVEIKAIVR